MAKYTFRKDASGNVTEEILEIDMIDESTAPDWYHVLKSDWEFATL